MIIMLLWENKYFVEKIQPRPHGHMSLLKKTRRNGPGIGHPRDRNIPIIWEYFCHVGWPRLTKNRNASIII